MADNFFINADSEVILAVGERDARPKGIFLRPVNKRLRRRAERRKAARRDAKRRKRPGGATLPAR